jgi:hypothetical protein
MKVRYIGLQLSQTVSQGSFRAKRPHGIDSKPNPFRSGNGAVVVEIRGYRVTMAFEQLKLRIENGILATTLLIGSVDHQHPHYAQ